MKVFKRPGSSYYAYKFQYRGREYYRSTGTENRREAESIAAAARARVLRQAAGLEEPEPLPRALPPEELRKHIPTLSEFQATFDEWVGTAKAEQKGTVKFYRESYQKLLDYGPWSQLTLAEIEEPQIEAFKTWALKHAGRRRNGFEDHGESLSRHPAQGPPLRPSQAEDHRQGTGGRAVQPG